MAGNVVTSNPLQVGADTTALTYEGIDAMFLEQYDQQNVFVDEVMLHRKATMQPGEKSRSFERFGDLINTGGYHDRGVFIEGGTAVQDQVSVTLDRPYIHAARIDYWDGDISKHPQIPRHVKDLARIQAERMNTIISRLLVIGARQAGVTNVHDGGNTITRTAADVATAYPDTDGGADNIESDIASAAQALNDRDVPRTGRVLFVRPREIKVLTRHGRVVNRDYTTEDIGSIARHAVTELHGWSIVPTTYMPSTNVTNDLAKYNGDFTVTTRQPVMIGAHVDMTSPPLGMVTTPNMARTGVYMDEDRDAMFVKNAMTYGLGVISPWQCLEIGVTAP